MPSGTRKSRDNGKPRRPAKRRRFALTAEERRRLKSIEEIAKEQGKELRPWTDKDFEEMRKIGRGLFRSSEELHEFVKGIYERRRRGRRS